MFFSGIYFCPKMKMDTIANIIFGTKGYKPLSSSSSSDNDTPINVDTISIHHSSNDYPIPPDKLSIRIDDLHGSIIIYCPYIIKLFNHANYLAINELNLITDIPIKGAILLGDNIHYKYPCTLEGKYNMEDMFFRFDFKQDPISLIIFLVVRGKFIKIKKYKLSSKTKDYMKFDY